MKKIAGLLYGNDFPHLDHIAPLCALLNIPLLITDDIIEKLSKSLYPELIVRKCSLREVSKIAVEDYMVIISCLPKQLLDPLFFFEEHLYKKKLLTIWLSHGQSDKENLSALSKEKIALIHGPLMKKRLKEANTFNNLYRAIEIGNYRRAYFLNHLEFYRAWMEKTLYFKKKQPTLLYAPSWDNPNLEEITEDLLESLPLDLNLIIKWHPNSLENGKSPYFKEKSTLLTNVCWLEESPVIYPLLSSCDYYVGDSSSIAYDFLSFNKPLFFFTPPSTNIHQAGCFTRPEAIASKIQDKDFFQEIRKKMYKEAYSETDISTLPKMITSCIESYFEEEIHTL